MPYLVPSALGPAALHTGDVRGLGSLGTCRLQHAGAERPHRRSARRAIFRVLHPKQAVRIADRVGPDDTLGLRVEQHAPQRKFRRRFVIRHGRKIGEHAGDEGTIVQTYIQASVSASVYSGPHSARSGMARRRLTNAARSSGPGWIGRRPPHQVEAGELGCSQDAAIGKHIGEAVEDAAPPRSRGSGLCTQRQNTPPSVNRDFANAKNSRV